MSQNRPLRIGFKYFTLDFESGLTTYGDPSCANVDYWKCEAKLDTDDDPQTQWHALMHERGHGALYDAGFIDDSAHQEQWLDCVMSGVCQFLIDNEFMQNPQKFAEFVEKHKAQLKAE